MRLCAALFAVSAAFLAAEETTPAPTPAPAEAVAPATDDASLMKDASYAIGRDIGSRVTGVVKQYDLDPDRFMSGLKSVLENTESEMSPERMQEVLMAFQQMQQTKAMEAQQREAAEAPMRLEKNKAWLAENATKPGIVVLPSGLQYEILKSGDAAGASPAMGVQVECHYTGTKLDGTVFDSSVERGQPAQFGVGQLIAGWNEALQLMKPGDKWKLYIPSELAYGEQAPPDIGANQILIFELELRKVLK
jgi:FKBP-type peptidyl-prolyl cis-trans isomerase FklB